MEGIVVSNLPIWDCIIMFLVYIATHFGIGVWIKNLEKQLVEDTKNIKLKTNIKYLNILFKWYPFLYVILILIFMF
jgi:hypothetical protein